MKLKFKQQTYQSDAVKAVVDCFAGQPMSRGFKYAIDPGRATVGRTADLLGDGFANDRIVLSAAQLLENVQGVQRHQNLTIRFDYQRAEGHCYRRASGL